MDITKQTVDEIEVHLENIITCTVYRDFQKFTLFDDCETITSDHTVYIPPPKPTWYDTYLNAIGKQFEKEFVEGVVYGTKSVDSQNEKLYQIGK